MKIFERCYAIDDVLCDKGQMLFHMVIRSAKKHISRHRSRVLFSSACTFQQQASPVTGIPRGSPVHSDNDKTSLGAYNPVISKSKAQLFGFRSI